MGVAKFDVGTGVQLKGKASAPSFTSIFANSLSMLLRKIVPSLASPLLCLEVQEWIYSAAASLSVPSTWALRSSNAITFAAGMACEGLKPFACIYSTFLQRGYDQVVHDVAVQNLPVRMILDRAGLVGNDGRHITDATICPT